MGIRRSTVALVGTVGVVVLVSCASGTASSADVVDSTGVTGPTDAAFVSSTSAIAVSTSTVDPPDPADVTTPADPDPAPGAGEAPEPSDPLEAEKAELDAAVASADLCEVYAALGALAVSVDDLPDLARTLDLVSATLDAATTLVPAGLEEAWTVMERQIDRARRELSKPDATTASIKGIFAAPEYDDATELIDDWQRSSCG